MEKQMAGLKDTLEQMLDALEGFGCEDVERYREAVDGVERLLEACKVARDFASRPGMDCDESGRVYRLCHDAVEDVEGRAGFRFEPSCGKCGEVLGEGDRFEGCCNGCAGI